MPENASSKPFRGPWMVAACFLTFGISTGFPYYNIAFFFDYLASHHGWTQNEVTLGAPIAVLLTIWAGPLIVPRVSPRLLILVGTGLTFGAFQWFGRLGGSDYEYYGAWCLYMLGYFLAGPIPHQIIISNWYKERRGFAMGITYIGVAVVGAAVNMIGPRLMTHLRQDLPPEGGYISTFDSIMGSVALWVRDGAATGLADDVAYTSALKFLGFLALAAWPLALFVIKDRPEDVGQVADGKETPSGAALKPAKPPKDFAFLTSKSSFWLLLVGSAASIGAIACVNFLMKFVFQEQGFTDQSALDAIWGKAQSTILIASILGRILAGYLADKLPRKWVMLATYAIVAAAIPTLFLVTPSSEGFVYVFAILFGFAMGADYMLIPLMAADQFGLSTLGRAMSAILPTDTITQFWFPTFVAQLRQAWGGYSSALWAVFGIAALGAIAIGLLPRHHKPVDDD